uniref:Lymphocyte cytosolic protein 2 n=1 Tax=Erpetoichthys calabaricus TaxID=27687 RepID=A0A8C4T5E3_ERPCA
MNFSHVPSRSEVTQWGPSQLADYLKSMNLKDCDKVVKKHNINGHRFLELSENDLQKFPKTHAPLVTRLCIEIKKKEDRRGFFSKKPAAPKYQEQECMQDEAGWDSEEFEDDDDYESPDAEDDVGSDGDYEDPTEDGEGESDNEYEPPPVEPNEEQQSRIHAAKPISNNADYIDNPSRAPSMKMAPSQPPIPPQRPGSLPGGRTNMAVPPPPKREESPQRGFRPPKAAASAPLGPSIDRSKKPSTLERGAAGLPDRDAPVLGKKPPFADKGNVPLPRPSSVEKLPNVSKVSKPPLANERADAGMARRPPAQRPWAQDRRDEPHDDGLLPRPPVPQPGNSPFNSNTYPSKALPPKPGSFSADSQGASRTLPPRLQPGVNVNRSHSRGPSDMKSPAPPQQPHRPNAAASSYAADNQDLNSEWYIAGISRKEAEECVWTMNQDGAFLVRDSSKRSTTQPYVLMVLYQDKVFNIQIRYQEEQRVYLLGTGIKGKENFSSVTEIIEYHKQAPLLLIDGKDRGSGHKRQCCLTYPAQY